jgi:hypothetical protein
MTTPEPRQTDSCPECAALVDDLARHADWHARVVQGAGLAPTGPDRGLDAGDEGDPGERTIGNMR